MSRVIRSKNPVVSILRNSLDGLGACITRTDFRQVGDDDLVVAAKRAVIFEDHKISTVERRFHRIARDPYHKAAGLCEPSRNLNPTKLFHVIDRIGKEAGAARQRIVKEPDQSADLSARKSNNKGRLIPRMADDTSARLIQRPHMRVTLVLKPAKGHR